MNNIIIRPDSIQRDIVRLSRHNLRWASTVLLNRPIFPFQHVILDMLWEKTFPMLLLTRGGGKSFILALYAVLRALLEQGSGPGQGAKIVFVTPSFRQSKNIFNYIKDMIYPNSPILQQASEKPPIIANDLCYFNIGNSSIKAIPLGTGEKIRGMRATHILIDEVHAVPDNILQEVIRGFAAVAQNPLERHQQIQRRKMLIEQGLLDPNIEDDYKGNQIVYSGTANYHFNHFYKKYQIQKFIIENKIVGSDRELVNQFPEYSGSIGANLNYKNYGLIQIPYDKMPEGFMDDTIIADGKMHMSISKFMMEYGAQFVEDSEGFFKRSLIEFATPEPPEETPVEIELKGNPSYKYVMGIDPARTADNFSIVIIKLLESRCDIVYCWAINKKSYIICKDKIIDLYKKFNIVGMYMDDGGGGLAIMDMLEVEEGCPILNIDDEDPHKAGHRVLEMIPYQGKWIPESNHALKANMESKIMSFPYHSSDDKYSSHKDMLDEAGEVYENIEELKDELVHIEVIGTGKSDNEGFISRKKRKDRYSALLMANYGANKIKRGDITEIDPSDSLIAGDWSGNLG